MNVMKLIKSDDEFLVISNAFKYRTTKICPCFTFFNSHKEIILDFRLFNGSTLDVLNTI